MHRTTFVLATLFASLALLPTSAAAQSSRCADCHFQYPDAPEPQHVNAWDRSAHGRNLVGCEACHGGDATTFEAFLAHQGIMNSRNPASPVNRINLPRTCGTCHPGPFVAFQNSRHYELLRQGDPEVPVCVTCHGHVAAELLSPKALASQCNRCHGPKGVAPRSDFPVSGRTMQEGIRDVRELMKTAERLIKRVEDPARRTQLEEAYQQAEVPIIEATQAGHAFVFDALEERLSVARARVTKLLEDLVNR